MIYLQSSIKLHPGKLQDFTSVMSELLPVLTGKHGWRLVGSYATLVGRFNTVLDLWSCRISARTRPRSPIRTS